MDIMIEPSFWQKAQNQTIALPIRNEGSVPVGRFASGEVFYLVESTKHLIPKQTWISETAVGNQGTSARNQNAAMDAVSVVLYELAIRTDGKTL